ncbi:MAG: YARHG domain-containing protein [Flavobacteriaceae bacterium]|nr:YARHG domain-containing protein [Flavobacteriaceae bacterium]
MKKIVFFIVIALGISCKEEHKKEIPLLNNENDLEAVANMLDTQAEMENSGFEIKNLLGSYVGMFVADDFKYGEKASFQNKINITIDSLTNQTIYGHSIVAGNSRPFEGTINLETLKASVKEPGDDKYDGVFEFTISNNEKSLEGTWLANDKKLKVTKRKYILSKMIFKYNPSFNLEKDDSFDFQILTDNYDEKIEGAMELESIDGDIIAELNASVDKLENTDIENLNKGELEVVRNMIYARHGYSFKNRKMRYFFDEMDWYIPVSTDVRDQLTEIELKNIDLLKRYEQHAEAYYDYFGR